MMAHEGGMVLELSTNVRDVESTIDLEDDVGPFEIWIRRQ
jgi:hypothetical protein